MTAVGQLYDRHKPAKAAAHVGPSLAIDPLAMLADEQRNIATHIEQRLGELRGPRIPDGGRIEFPSPPAGRFDDGMKGDMVQIELAPDPLLGDQAKPSQGLGPVRIDIARRLDLDRIRRAMLSRRLYRGINDDDAGKAVAVRGAGHDADEASHAVPDDEC